jgi:hypothetical protein
MKALDSNKLDKGCQSVIDCLHDYAPEYKIAILRLLIDSFPVDYIMKEEQKKCTCPRPDDWLYTDKKVCGRCGGAL